jgi:hypothetical protein
MGLVDAVVDVCGVYTVGLSMQLDMKEKLR